MDLLGLLATKTAATLEMLGGLGWRDGVSSDRLTANNGSDLALLQRVAERLPAAGASAPTVRKLLTMAEELLSAETSAEMEPSAGPES